MPPINRGDLVYVAYQPGDLPNMLRSWPQRSDRNDIGSAPEGAAMQIARATTITSVVDGRSKSYPTPYRSPDDGVTWWYVRSFQGQANAPRGKVVNAWTAQNGLINGQRKEFLEPLTSHTYHCGRPGQPPLKSYLTDTKRAYVVTNRLPLLSGAGGGYEILGYLAIGETLTVLGAPECDTHGRLWWQSDHYGWWVCETEQVAQGLRLNLVPLTV